MGDKDKYELRERIRVTSGKVNKDIGQREEKVRFRERGHDILRGTNKPSPIKL